MLPTQANTAKWYSTVARTNNLDDVWQYIEMRSVDECWPWHGSWGGRQRHRLPYFYTEGDRYVAYRLVFEQHTGAPPKHMVLHSCDNGKHPIGCCNPYHLRDGTTQDNADDMMQRERHGLSYYVVRNIRRLRASGRTQAEVAELYGISRETVSAIDTGRQYSHVTDEDDNNGTRSDNGSILQEPET